MQICDNAAKKPVEIGGAEIQEKDRSRGSEGLNTWAVMANVTAEGSDAMEQHHIEEAADGGKCFPGDQMVYSPLGLLYVSEAFASVDLKATHGQSETPIEFPLFNLRGEIEPTSSFTRNGSRKLFRVITRTGGVITTTANHPHQVMNHHGWWVKRKAQHIEPGDHLLIQRSYHAAIGKPSSFSVDVLYFLGIVLADGYLGDNRVSVSNDDPVVQDAIFSYGKEALGRNALVYKPDRSTGSLAFHFNSKENVTAFYKSLDWGPCLAAGKHLGRILRSLDAEGMRAVLQGYIDCECSISDLGCIEVASASWKLLFEVKCALLAHFGIISVLRSRFVAEYPENNYWCLVMSGEEAENYVNRVGFRSKIRQERSTVCLNLGKSRNPNLDVIPRLGHLLTAIHEASETKREHVALVRDYKGDNPQAEVTYQQLRKILAARWGDGPALERLRQINAANYYYDEVIAVEKLEAKPTFDFTVPGSHSLILNGFVSRNSDDRVASAFSTAA